MIGPGAGVLIVVEGPNGVGKSTLTSALARALPMRGLSPVHRTREPSRSALGELLRASEETLRGRAYALALAADRYDQEEREITPRLVTGCHVVTDRYVHSSLVLQRIDGLSLEEVWSYNAHVRQPDVTICLDEDPAVRRARLGARGTRTRLERADGPERESQLYDEACTFLSELGWAHIRVDCRGMTPTTVLAATLGQLEAMPWFPRPLRRRSEAAHE
jgi:dTMP kinase